MIDMNFTYTFIIINLFVWIPWLWIYKVNPYFIKRALNNRLKEHPQWNDVKKIEALLGKLYRGVNASRLSKKELKRLSIKNDDFVYGEVDFLSFFTLLERCQPKTGEIFYDLGSGSGKAVFSAALFFNLGKAYGIELLHDLYNLSNEQIKKCRSLIKKNDKKYYDTISKKVMKINFINRNFLETNIKSADIIYINATCMNPATWDGIIQKLIELKSGSRIIVNTKKIEHERFKLLYSGGELMSWGLGRVRIYIKTS